MKIKLLFIGKTTPAFMTTGVDVYLERLKHYCSLDVEVIADVKRSPGLSPAKLCEMESALFLKRLKPNDHVVLLDENGLLQDSIKMANSLERWIGSGSVSPVFIVGGAYGFADVIRERANALWSLSPLTFSHQLARLVFVEQLYRSFTIIKGEPYHHK